MGLLDKLKGPVFVKETSDAKEQLEKLKEIYEIAPDEIKEQVDQDIKMLAYGISGEDNVAFELKNSFMPLLILHDLHFEYEGLSAQIDYLIITKKIVLVLECKNMIGNIEINNNGDFIRTFDFGRKKRKEGIYSPITQNQRHLDIIKMIRRNDMTGMIAKLFFDKSFHSAYKSIIVLANKKTIVNMKYAKKEVKEQIIRCDQLIEYIKRFNDACTNSPMSDKEMYEVAESFLKHHIPNKTDYTEKYGIEKISNETRKSTVIVQSEVVITKKEENVNRTLPQLKKQVEEKIEEPLDVLLKDIQEVQCSEKSVNTKDVTNLTSTVNTTMAIEETPIYKELKEFRYKKSKEESIKAYFIYNNIQMEDIIKSMPITIEDLKRVNGFGEQKCNKYGGDILKIVNKHL